MTSRIKIVPGSILEVVTPQGMAYVKYIGTHAKYGDTIRVLPRLFTERPPDVSTLDWSRGYYAFYPARAAVSASLVELVETAPIPGEISVPRDLRRPGARSADGRVLAWVIIHDQSEALAKALTADEQRLPIASIWNHELLRTRLVQGWRPEDSV
jgi:hypothetical protein